MIAPLRPAQERRSSPRRSFIHARRAIAAAFFAGQETSVVPGNLKSWKAWSIAAWMCAVAVFYVITLVWSRLT